MKTKNVDCVVFFRWGSHCGAERVDGYGTGYGKGGPSKGELDIHYIKITNGVGKTIFVKFQAHIVFCFGVFGVFVCFSGADFIFYDFTFSSGTGAASRKMQNRKK